MSINYSEVDEDHEGTDHHEDRKKNQRSRLADAMRLPDSVIDKKTTYYGQKIREFPKDSTVSDLRSLILSS